jgi:hypothetical protein
MRMSLERALSDSLVRFLTREVRSYQRRIPTTSRTSRSTSAPVLPDREVQLRRGGAVRISAAGVAGPGPDGAEGKIEDVTVREIT